MSTEQIELHELKDYLTGKITKVEKLSYDLFWILNDRLKAVEESLNIPAPSDKE